jgi:hypothetical protein
MRGCEKDRNEQKGTKRKFGRDWLEYLEWTGKWRVK